MNRSVPIADLLLIAVLFTDLLRQIWNIYGAIKEPLWSVHGQIALHVPHI